jgi:hypothetical protein
MIARNRPVRQTKRAVPRISGRRRPSEQRRGYPFVICVPQSILVPNDPHRPQSAIHGRTFKIVIDQKHRHQFPRFLTHLLGPDLVAKVHMSVYDALFDYTFTSLRGRCGFPLGLGLFS